ncbi:MAG: TerC/Alx family metal homeostasis membrane protein [Acidobacteria bacterium]|nr:TerC/Alx family metal homeostasis membrane protein [Acidobacteriota bacterium]
MEGLLLFPFAQYWGFYLGFTGLVLFLLLLDLGFFHREAHEVSFKEASIWTVVWISLALLFGVGLYGYALWDLPQETRLTSIPGFQAEDAAWQVFLEYLTGLVVEKSLAVDNIFIFVVVFNFFAIPPRYQHRVLFYGILGALVFRALFIAAGSVLMQYKIIVIVFGAFLILTGIKILFAPEKPIDPERNPLIRLLKRFLPVTPAIEGQRFFLRRDGRLYATPLFIALAFIEISDIIFAVDSVPAIFAITKEPLIVYTSNVFAILGLRAMYFLLAGVVHRFRMLKYGLGLILVFVGLKMVWLNELYGGKFPIGWSLGIIAALLAGSIALSLIVTRGEKGAPGH